MIATNKLRFRTHKEDDGTTIVWHHILQQWWQPEFPHTIVYADGRNEVVGEWRDVPVVLP